ncbi:hypothetical protein [Geodermatophilus sp. URMC 62]|uniref:hypothetical protein n=1 Tax=Geodermatophilus sp. URMC 62 TaxID=3423414 RepID=UPI00406C90D3
MSAERVVVVALPRDERVGQLVLDIASAAERSLKADPGDRTDVVRYESLSVQLEAAAAARMAAGGPSMPLAVSAAPDVGLAFGVASLRDPVGPALVDRLTGQAAEAAREWINAGNVAVLLRLPFSPSELPEAIEPVAAPEPELPWEAPEGAVGRRAVEERFRAQLLAACAEQATETRLAVNPSGVHNRVLAEVLHEFVEGTPTARLDAPIVYRDGSQASHAFPLRCLPLGQPAPHRADRELHLTLLSIRHTEMDPIVDGAWLRNAEVSRPRPAAQTDDFVYETSRQQLRQLTDFGRSTALLHIYQTGLDTAVVGFYRALVVHLLEYPGTVTVIPMYYAAGPAEQDAIVRPEARFEAGKAWSMGERA